VNVCYPGRKDLPGEQVSDHWLIVPLFKTEQGVHAYNEVHYFHFGVDPYSRMHLVLYWHFVQRFIELDNLVRS
jgi:hypothetical protein